MTNAKRYLPNAKKNPTVHDSVLAIKVTERNLISTKDWIAKFTDDQVVAIMKVDAKGDVSDHRIKVKTPKGWRVARVGEFVVRHFNYHPVDKPFEAGDPIYYFTVGKNEFLQEHTLSPKGYFA